MPSPNNRALPSSPTAPVSTTPDGSGTASSPDRSLATAGERSFEEQCSCCFRHMQNESPLSRSGGGGAGGRGPFPRSDGVGAARVGPRGFDHARRLEGDLLRIDRSAARTPGGGATPDRRHLRVAL